MSKEQVVYYDENRLLLPSEMAPIFRILIHHITNCNVFDVQDFELNIPASESLKECFTRNVKYWLSWYCNACFYQTMYFQETVAALGRYDMFKCKRFFDSLEEEVLHYLRYLEDSHNFINQISLFSLMLNKIRKGVRQFAQSENIPSFVDLFEDHMKRVNEIWYRLVIRVLDGEISLHTVSERDIMGWIEEQVGVQPESCFNQVQSWLDSSFNQITYVYQGETTKRKRKVVSL